MLAREAAVPSGNLPVDTRSAAPLTAPLPINGSSPWTFTIVVKPRKRGWEATSATRSVPEVCSSLVMTHSAPTDRTADATDSSSVATTTASATFIWEILCQTRTMRGSPERRRRGFRGRRMAPRRAGMTTSVPIYPPVFARCDAKVTLSNIPT